MKQRIICTIVGLFLLISLGQSQDVLLEINDEKITVDEFLRVYNKNNHPGSTVEMKTVDEYLDLYINYKLKVKEAQRLGMDTLQAFKDEYGKYKKQLTDSYLTDDSFLDSLVQEAYERSMYEVNASHLMVKLDANASPEDTAKAYKKIMDIRKRIVEKGESFEMLAEELSDDPSAATNKGNLGYFSAFRMVYPFENAAFNTPVGDVSMPVRTQFGYHLLKVNDKRKSQGAITTAHIMILTPQGSSQEQIDTAEAKINRIYEELQQGADFNELVKEYSEDRNSARNKGILRPFKAGQMVSEFEEAAFALEQDGDISVPVQTAYGWHIIKRISLEPVKPLEELREELVSNIKRSDRQNVPKEKYIDNLKKEYQFELNQANLNAYAKAYEKSMSEGTEVSSTTLDKALFTIDGKPYEIGEFHKYLANSRLGKDAVLAQINNKLNEFSEKSILAYEESRLHEKYPDYKHLVNEYYDGILLFNLMDSMVWTKAVKDSLGLQEYYFSNKDNYMWNDRVYAISYELDSAKYNEKSAKKEAKAIIKGKLSTNKLLVNYCDSLSNNCLNLIEVKVEKGVDKEIDKTDWKKGYYITPNEDGGAKILVIHSILPPENKKLNEARGLITSDYQNYLEKNWIKELRSRYEITIHESALEKARNQAIAQQ